MDTLPHHASEGNTPLKRCPKCGVTYPATSEFFWRDKTAKDGLRTPCRQCRLKPPKVSGVPEGHRRCSVCKVILPATTDFFHRNGKSGLYQQCKICKRKTQKAYLSNPETYKYRLAHHRDYMRRADIRERTRIQGLAYRQRPGYHEHRRAYKKAHYQIVRDHIRSQNRAYYRRVSVSTHQWRTYGQNRRSRKRGVSGTYTPQQIQELLKRQRYCCYYCHDKFERRGRGYVYHIDHTFPLSRVIGTDIPANDISYLVLSCPTCNLRKGDKFPWEFPEGGRLL